MELIYIKQSVHFLSRNLSETAMLKGILAVSQAKKPGRDLHKLRLLQTRCRPSYTAALEDWIFWEIAPLAVSQAKKLPAILYSYA